MVDLDRAGSGAAELASRQAKLQKALSTAYLNHQIAELETKVKAAKITPTPNPAPQVQQGNDGMSDVMVPPRDPNDDLGRADDVEDPDDEDGSIWRVVVVDVSALMWAKNAVKRLVQKGWEVIVPLEAIRTLDLLKKGSSASAIAARQAARYIEHASRFHQPISSNPSYSIQRGTNYRKGRGLRIQREDEVRAVDTLLDELALPPMDGESSLPTWVQSVFTCVAFFKWIGDTDAEGDGAAEITHGYDMLGPVLFVANPPVFVEVSQGRSQPTPSAREDDARDIDYTARGEGHVILQEAARFDLSLEVLRDDDVEVEESNLGRGRGKGGKGRGREGRGKKGDRGRDNRRGEGKRQQMIEPEPQREIKILLRREIPSGQGEDFPSPESRESTLQSTTISPAMPPPQLRSKTDNFPPPAQASPFVMDIQGRPPPFSHRGHGHGLGRGRGHHGWGFRPPPPPMDIDGFPALGLPPPPPAPPPVPAEHMLPPPPPGPPHHKGTIPHIHDIPAPPSPPVMQAHPRHKSEDLHPHFDHDRRGPPSPQLFGTEVKDERGSRNGNWGHGHGREHSLEREHSHRHEHHHRGGEGRGRGRGGEGRGGGRGGGSGRGCGHSHGREGGGGGGGFTLLQRPDRPSARDQQSVLLASTPTLIRKDDFTDRKDRDRPYIRSREREEPKVVLLQRPK